MAEIAAATKTAAAALTIEIGTRSGSRYGCRTRHRVRDRDAIRVAVTYRLQAPDHGPPDEAELARFIRHGVREVRRAYRLARTPAVRRDTAPPHPEQVPLARAREEPAASVGCEVSDPGQKEAKEVVKAEMDTLSCTDPIGADSALEKEEPTPRRLTRTQRSTLDVMARQLDLTGAALPQLLGLRCNRKSLDDLSYREAAGLIAHFSRLLRQRLQQEREAKNIPSPQKGEKPPPEHA